MIRWLKKNWPIVTNTALECLRILILHGSGVFNTRIKSNHEAQMPQDSYEDGRIDLTPLHHAVQQYEADHIRSRLADYKQYANVADKNGQTPLHYAVKNGKDDVARLLVAELGADANVTDRDGQTPLHIAVVNGRVEVAGLIARKTTLTKLNFRRYVRTERRLFE